MQSRKSDAPVAVPKLAKDLYRLKDVADRLSLCYRTLHRAVREGRIKSVRCGGAVMIPAGELNRIVERGF
jgi:excisionase family DNA binding protein